MNKKKIMIIVSSIILVLVALFTTTYSLFYKEDVAANPSNYSTGILQIEATSLSDTISLDSALPMTDEEGIETTPYVFSIKNTGNVDYKFDVKLLSTSSNTINSQYIKLKIDNDNPVSKKIFFDKDDFQDFDEAIVEGTKKGYQVAWSNQSFEYWAYLHFFYSDSALHRDEWCKKLDAIFSERKLGGGKYQKNAHDLYEQLASSEGLVIAIKHAKRRMSTFNGDRLRPSLFDPGTTMHLLMEDLNKFLEE